MIRSIGISAMQISCITPYRNKPNALMIKKPYCLNDIYNQYCLKRNHWKSRRKYHNKYSTMHRPFLLIPQILF